MSDNIHRYTVRPIGFVRADDEEERPFAVEVLPQYRPALLRLDAFSHVIVLWWASAADAEEYRTMTQAEVPYGDNALTGIFATRSPARPNPIAMTTTRILSMDQEAGVLKLAYLDAFDGTPVLNLKAYTTVSDRVKEVTMPDWLADWPAWLPEEDPA